MTTSRHSYVGAYACPDIFQWTEASNIGAYLKPITPNGMVSCIASGSMSAAMAPVYSLALQHAPAPCRIVKLPNYRQPHASDLQITLICCR